MRQSIVLIGMRGAGKTAVGSELARQLGVTFTDSDAEIQTAAAMTIPEIFARDGEAFFRARETQVLSRILSGPPAVVATGGGAWLQPANRQLIRNAALSVWLDCDLQILWNRVRHRTTRPLLMTADPFGTLSAMLEQRAPVYATADVRLRVGSDDSITLTAQRLLDAIRTTRPHLLEPA